LDELGVDGRTVLKCILRAVEWKGVNWIRMPLNTDKWRTLVNTAMKIRIPPNAWNVLTSGGNGSFSRTRMKRGVSYLAAHCRPSAADIVRVALRGNYEIPAPL
jgi:hypothetical protein